MFFLFSNETTYILQDIKIILPQNSPLTFKGTLRVPGEIQGHGKYNKPAAHAEPELCLLHLLNLQYILKLKSSNKEGAISDNPEIFDVQKNFSGSKKKI